MWSLLADATDGKQRGALPHPRINLPNNLEEYLTFGMLGFVFLCALGMFIYAFWTPRHTPRRKR